MMNILRGGTHVPEDSKQEIKITLYSNGFTVNNGEFRDYEDPANKTFMKELKDG
jgi:UBX domain-containing protein 1